MRSPAVWSSDPESRGNKFDSRLAQVMFDFSVIFGMCWDVFWNCVGALLDWLGMVLTHNSQTVHKRVGRTCILLLLSLSLSLSIYIYLYIYPSPLEALYNIWGSLRGSSSSREGQMFGYGAAHFSGTEFGGRAPPQTKTNHAQG